MMVDGGNAASAAYVVKNTTGDDMTTGQDA